MVLRGFKYLFDGGFVCLLGSIASYQFAVRETSQRFGYGSAFLRYMLALVFLLGGNAQLLLTSRYLEYMKRAQGGVLLLCYLIAMGHGNKSSETSWVAFQVFLA